MAKFKLFRLIILTGILFFCFFTGWAQTILKNDSNYFKKDSPKHESKRSLVFSGSFVHFQGKQNDLVANDVSGINDYYSIGYRVKDNWMGYYRQRFFYGLTLNYQLKFSKK